MVGAKVKFLYIDKYVYVQFYAICNGEYERIIIIDGIYDRLIYTIGLNHKIFVVHHHHRWHVRSFFVSHHRH